ncbi:MAG: MFS transporter, partial [Chloroflexi bacterium]|nr:MFS transporter [Chloroflexota bacterium]
VPYFAVVQYGMDTAASGAALTPRSITVMLASMMTSLFILRLGYRVPMIVGMIVIAISFFLLSLGLSSVLIGPLELDGFWLTWAAMAISGAGVGLTSPAANNATIDLLPERTAAITGLRGMFRISGGIIGISSIVLALSFFNDQAAGMRTIFLALAFFLLAGVPLALTIPDTARERWRQQQLRGIQQ